jgi:hypothetical protein
MPPVPGVDCPNNIAEQNAAQNSVASIVNGSRKLNRLPETRKKEFSIVHLSGFFVAKQFSA